MDNVKYEIFVRTGDKLFSGTDANVFIVLHGEKGRKSDVIKLDCFFRNDLERGQLDQYAVKCINLGKVNTIELWRDDAGFKSNWYVDYIKVVDTTSSDEYSFPILRWIKANFHYKIAHLDTSLPADDPHVGQRIEGLRDKRKVYVLRKGPYNLPAQVHELVDRQETFVESARAVENARKVINGATSILQRLLTNDIMDPAKFRSLMHKLMITYYDVYNINYKV